MSNETKQDVFEELLDAYDDAKSSDGNLHPTQELLDYDDRYADALPDDIATVPADVGERIKLFRERYLDLVDAFGPLKDYAVMRQEPSDPVQAWMLHNSFVVARAWLDGVWIEAESGKVVRS